MVDKLVSAILGVLLSPLAVFLERGCGCDFLINLLLFCCFVFPGAIHHFHLKGVECYANIMAVLLPPLGTFMRVGCALEFWLCVVLTLCGIVPGMIYAYYTLL